MSKLCIYPTKMQLIYDKITLKEFVVYIIDTPENTRCVKCDNKITYIWRTQNLPLLANNTVVCHKCDTLNIFRDNGELDYLTPDELVKIDTVGVEYVKKVHEKNKCGHLENETS